jgi:hypothetical protein
LYISETISLSVPQFPCLVDVNKQITSHEVWNSIPIELRQQKNKIYRQRMNFFVDYSQKNYLPQGKLKSTN